jgi:predicted AAA+ superfamily ATPase
MKKRLIYNQILGQKDTKKASIIIGPRQVGKTTILKELHRNLGGLFFDVDIFTDYDRVATYEKLIATLKINGYKENQEDRFFVFLDEFRRYSDLSRVIKSVYDHHNNIKIYATGSSSLEIKNSIQESLAGRKIITSIYPLDFEEFLYFKEREDLINQIHRLNGLESDDYFSLVPDARALLDEFLVFGGYPEVVLAATPETKQDALRSIFDLYIKKDFVEYARAEKLRNASQLLRLLAINNGQLVNYAKYAAAAELNMETVKRYVSILEETFIIVSLRPYFTNKNKEITKMPKVYFLDNGVRNYFGGGFSDIQSRSDAGFLFEGFVISELLKKRVDASDIKYYRSKSGEEIDIVLERANRPLLPIEIKWKKSIGVRDISSVKRFVEKHSLPKGIIVNLGQLKKLGKLELADCFRKVEEI